MFVSVYTCMCIYMYVHMYVCMYVRTYVTALPQPAVCLASPIKYFVLFKDSVSSSGCIAQSAKAITEWCTGKGVEESTRGLIWSKVLPSQLSEGAEKDHENPESILSMSRLKSEQVLPEVQARSFIASSVERVLTKFSTSRSELSISEQISCPFSTWNITRSLYEVQTKYYQFSENTCQITYTGRNIHVANRDLQVSTKHNTN
jgi:hypothetical protein